MATAKIVILNWNGLRHLEQYLPKVIAATPVDVGIVVADNGSTDASVEYVSQRFPEVELLVMEENYGYAEGYNRALEQLESDYFVLMNSDVEPCEGWLEPLMDAMEADRNLVAASPKILSYDERGNFEYAGAAGGFIDSLGYPFCRGRILSTIEADHGQYDDARRVLWASGACMIVRADRFAEIGGFDNDFFVHMEEIDFCWRAQILGYDVMTVPQSVVCHLGGGTLPNNSPKKLYYNFRNNLAMLYKNLPPERLHRVLFARMVLDGCSAAVYLLMGRWSFVSAVYNAHRDYRSWHKRLQQKRGQIALKAKNYNVDTVYRGSILLRYMLGYHRFDKLM